MIAINAASRQSSLNLGTPPSTRTNSISETRRINVQTKLTSRDPHQAGRTLQCIGLRFPPNHNGQNAGLSGSTAARLTEYFATSEVSRLVRRRKSTRNMTTTRAYPSPIVRILWLAAAADRTEHSRHGEDGPLYLHTGNQNRQALWDSQCVSCVQNPPLSLLPCVRRPGLPSPSNPSRRASRATGLNSMGWPRRGSPFG